MSRKKAGKTSFLLGYPVEETAHLGRKDREMNTKVSADCLVEWWRSLTDPQKDAFADDPAKVSALLLERVKKIAASIFVNPLSDQEAIALLVQGKKYSPEQAEVIVKPWRKYAASLGYAGPVVWKVRQGFTLKTHAPLAGPCYKDLAYLQSWNFPDKPTEDSLVFWVPRFAEQSTNKSIGQMEAHRATLLKAHNLPTSHCDRFGSIGLQFALILAHHKRTGERVPLNYLYAASDTLDAGGRRLIAGLFDQGGLSCSSWRGSRGSDGVGFFLLGVEKLGQPAPKAGE